MAHARPETQGLARRRAESNNRLTEAIFHWARAARVDGVPEMLQDSQSARAGGGRSVLCLAAMLTVCLCFLMLPGLSPAETPQVGKVTFMLNAKSPFDPFVSNPTEAQKSWMDGKYWRVRAYPPFFDRALGWSPEAHVYKDLYAIYRDHDQSYLTDHPDWYLRDSRGKALYIPYGCSGGSCPQYAADIGNPAWREHWIGEVKAEMAKGYMGVFIDDMNLEMNVGDGAGDQVRPFDPRTGKPMTDADWKRYMVEFVEQVRREVPDAWISHNSAWWQDESDPFVKREVQAADAIELERGFSDPGLTPGGGKFGFESFLDHIDWLHSLGKSVILEPYNLDTASKREFEVASYFLVQQGEDALASDDRSYPDNWWSGWSTDIGAAKGKRYAWNGLLRRDFAGGFVLVNQPGAPARSATLGGTYTTLAGEKVSSVNLAGGQGVVLRPTSPGQTTDPVRALVPTSTLIKLQRKRDLGGKKVTARGRVRFATRGSVRLTLSKRSSNGRGGWQSARVIRTHLDSRGGFKKSFRHVRSGQYRILAKYSGCKGKRVSQARSRLRIN